MDSRELLSAVLDVTSPDGVGKVNLKDEEIIKSDYYYYDDKVFNEPLIIRGTNKQLVPAENLVSLDDEGKCSIDSVIEMCNKVDNALRIHTVDNIAMLDMLFVGDSYIVVNDTFANDGDGKYFAIFKDSKSDNDIAFKNWSELLKVPYTFSKKNPSFLNESNFTYWKSYLTTAQDKQIPVDFIYLESPIEIEVEEGEAPITAYLLVNILKSQTVCERRGVVTEVKHPSIDERVPKISNILNNLQQQISTVRPDISQKVQQFSLGYTGTNKGRHYARIVLEDSGSDFEIEGERFLPAITVESDFIGKSKDFGEVILTFSLFREVCSNGLVVNWTDTQKQSVRNSFILNYCKNRGVVTGDEIYLDTVSDANSKFDTVFSNNGIRLSVAIANSTFSGALFRNIFEFFLSSIYVMRTSLESLAEETFKGVSDKDFVNTVHNLGASMQIHPDIIKYFLLEYLVGSLESQDQLFSNPLDVVNFITYICRVFDSSIQLDVEKKAYAFAYSLMQILIHKQRSEDFIYESYRRKINQSVL